MFVFDCMIGLLNRSKDTGFEAEVQRYSVSSRAPIRVVRSVEDLKQNRSRRRKAVDDMQQGFVLHGLTAAATGVLNRGCAEVPMRVLLARIPIP